MILCLDVGNSQIFGGVYSEDQLQFGFRYATTHSSTSDQLGIFLKTVLRENNLDSNYIDKIAICSVVPSLDYSLISACKKYFNLDPFILQAGVKTGLKIKYHNPLEVGADRIANAIAAAHLYPKQNVIVIDFGTATTFCAVSANKEYLGGVIMAGMRIAMDSLQANTAKLFPVEILKPDKIVGRSTRESIQSGLYYSQLGTVREIIQGFTKEVFNDQNPIVLGTGGFAHLFAAENIFTTVIPDLVTQGLRLAVKLNE